MDLGAAGKRLVVRLPAIRVAASIVVSFGGLRPGGGVSANACTVRVSTTSFVARIACACAAANLRLAGTSSGEATVAVGVAGSDREI